MWCWAIPGGGNFTATPARIREAIKLSGPDIYRDPQPVTRDVYTIRANVEQGNSGGPLIDLDGQVLGVVFGAAVDDPDTGFVLTAGEVSGQLAKIGDTATGAHRGLRQLMPAAVHLLEKPHQVPVDFLGCLFVAEMPCAGDGYVAAVRRVTLGALDRGGQHVGIGVTTQVQQRHTEWRGHRFHESPAFTRAAGCAPPSADTQVRSARPRESG